MYRKLDPLEQFEIKRRQDVHRKKLAAMRHSVDTRPPQEHRHLYRNAKKEAVLEEKYAKIEHENRLLLTKMSDIMTRSTEAEAASVALQHAHSLNRTVRSKELRRITEDNLRILHRIQTVTPQYDHVKWEEERAQQERLVESICEFKRSRAAADGSGSVYSTRSRSLGAAAGGGGSYYPAMAGSTGDGGPLVGASAAAPYGYDRAAAAGAGGSPTALGAFHAEGALSGSGSGGSAAFSYTAGGAGALPTAGSSMSYGGTGSRERIGGGSLAGAASMMLAGPSAGRSP